MLKAERRNFILTKLVKEQRVNTIELAEVLGLSEDTIRRDLNKLHEKGLLEKVYGGAIPVKDNDKNVFDIVISNEKKKREIGLKALSLLHDGQVIIMSGGTTNLVFSKLIPPLLKATIYTYSLPIAMQLSQYQNIDLIFIGGKMQKNAMVTIGMDVLQVLSKIKADICFMGASSVNVKQGLTEVGYEVSIVKKAMLEASDKVVSMFTADKLNSKTPHVVCSIDRLSTIITDLNPKDKILEEYHAAGVTVL
ncbi:DeoR/GlpR family DNA-binding transcription regulator [Flavobacterium degerlachei]|jgi:DeoR/GlpR family transcriptional regulator of sugar metabolism|uniref:Transcriptional regulator, DeoR family n=1 Tax=Flavobacterium degerlachei TaxID=229203 RepID=A0A1H2UQW9_9FLAO|nr:DeoR/GlpR family DNA-binding transcription regulator [Flavobacterium degerlachei]SDW58348.1 transcriptional regulator, DeoR family [Flavobacterium degerlachei]